MHRALVTEERSPLITKRASGRWIWASLAVLIAIGVILRLLRIGDTVFGDELSTLYIVRGNGLSGTVSAVASDAEISPPLYFVLAWLSTHLGSAPELVRLPSLLLGIASIPLAFMVGERVAGRLAGLLAAAFIAINPFMVFYSVDGRGYMLATFLLLVSTLALLLALDTGRGRWWVLYGAATSLAMYSHYTVAFVLAAQLGWVLWAHPGARRTALLANAAAAVVFLPWLPSLIADTNSPTIDVLAALQGSGFAAKRVALEAWAFGSPYVSPHQVPGALALRFGVAGLVVLGLACAVALLRGGLVTARGRLGEEAWRRVVLVVAMALATPAFEALLLLGGGTDLFGARNLLTSSAGVALSIGALAWAGRSRRIAALTVVCTLAAVAVFAALAVGAVRSVEPSNRSVDFKGPAQAIAANAHQGDVLVDAVSARTTPVPLTSIDAHLDFGGPEFRLYLPTGSPPFLAYGSPIPDPSVLLARAFDAARGHRLFLVGSDLEIGQAPAAAGPSVSIGGGVERVAIPPDWTVEARQSYEGINTIDLVVLGQGQP